MKDPVDIFGCRRGFSALEGAGSSLARAPSKDTGRKEDAEDFALPLATLLARIRKLVPGRHDDHYDEIARGFGNGALRVPPTPMSDQELSRAIAEFLREAPSVDSIGTLGRRLDPSSRL